MWYKTAQEKQKLEHFYNLLKANPDFNSTKRQFLELAQQIGEFHVDRRALQDAYKQISDEYLTRYREQKGTNPSQQSTNNTPPNPKPSPPPAPNTTVKDLTLDKADKLERLRPDQSPVNDFDVDTDKRIEDKDIKLIGTKDDPDADCIIEEEVFIQNLLTKLTGYAQIYFKRKIFTISQDTYSGNRSPLAPVQTALGLTPPGRLDPNTQAYDPASATGSPLGDFKRNRGTMTDPFGNPTAVMPVKDKTVVWNTGDVQSIMSSLEKIAQMPELQKYGAKEITNILRYPLLQIKSSGTSIKQQIADKKIQLNRYTPLLAMADVPFGLTREDVVKIIDDLRLEIDKLEKAREQEKPDVEVVPFKEFYKLSELSRYYMYKGSQLNGVFCTLQAQLIKTLNNTLNTLGRVEKNKRLKEIYENARGKK